VCCGSLASVVQVRQLEIQQQRVWQQQRVSMVFAHGLQAFKHVALCSRLYRMLPFSNRSYSERVCVASNKQGNRQHQLPHMTSWNYSVHLPEHTCMHACCLTTQCPAIARWCCAGKSTVACTLEHALLERGRLTALLDGDNVRHGLNKNLGFSSGAQAHEFVVKGLVCKHRCVLSFVRAVAVGCALRPQQAPGLQRRCASMS
jgi:hypothetical protein